jgi:hypothetical protein
MTKRLNDKIIVLENIDHFVAKLFCLMLFRWVVSICWEIVFVINLFGCGLAELGLSREAECSLLNARRELAGLTWFHNMRPAMSKFQNLRPAAQAILPCHFRHRLRNLWCLFFVANGENG